MKDTTTELPKTLPPTTEEDNQKDNTSEENPTAKENVSEPSLEPQEKKFDNDKDEKEEEIKDTQKEEKDTSSKDWKAITGLDDTSLTGAIESVIFISDRPISAQKIRDKIGRSIPIEEIQKSIFNLQEQYEQDYHGIRLVEVAEGYQFRTKSKFAPFLKSVYKGQSLSLSPSALEVLAIIAYKQPIQRTEIEKVRGTDSSHIIRALLDKTLISLVSRSEDLGRGACYGTTREFLEIFGLKSIKDLPPKYELEALIPDSEVGGPEEIRSLVQDSKKDPLNSDFEEIQELKNEIGNISADTPFTRSIRKQRPDEKTEENTPKKSSFEILEEHVLRAEIAKENRHSSQSNFPLEFGEEMNTPNVLTWESQDLQSSEAPPQTEGSATTTE